MHAKRLILSLLATGAIVTAVHAASVYKGAGEVQSLTRSSPLIDAPTAREFLSLEGVKKIRATLCTCTDSTCAAGSYPDPGPSASSKNGWLTGGTLAAWYKHPDAGWIPNPDLTLTVGTVDGGCRVWPDLESPAANSRGGIWFEALGVTQTYTDAGNYVQILLEGVNEE